MKRNVPTQSFLRSLALFLHRHPDLEEKTHVLIERLVTGSSEVRIHPLHGPLKGFYSARISQSYRLVFALEPDAVIFIDIGSHDEVY